MNLNTIFEDNKKILMTEPDLEANKRRPEYVAGYTDLSEFISSDPQLSIYRRYDRLATRNLVYLEAEMQLLEIRLQKIDEQELELTKACCQEEKESTEVEARCWEVFEQEAKKQQSRASVKMELAIKLKETVKEYEKAVLRRRDFTSLAAPDHNSANAFKRWFRHRKPLWGSGSHLLDDEDDLCTIYSGGDADRLTSIIQRYFGYHVRSERPNKTPDSWHLPGEKSIHYYPLSRITWIVAILSILISSMLLIGAIVVLYFVKEMSKRLGIVAAFTAAFAASLGLLTNARRAEIFGSTAAYAAVLVVFVGVDN